MNSIGPSENISADFCIHQEVPVDEGVISTLPSEILQHILFYLSNKEILSPHLVSHFWNKSAVDLVKKEEYSCRNSFVDFLIENIKDTNREKELLAIRANNNIFTMKSLKAVKLNTESSAELITRILLTVDQDKLHSLRGLHRVKKGSAFNNLLAIAELYKDLDKVKDEERLCKVDKLQRISMLLTAYRKIDKAVAVAYTIPDDCERSLTIQGVSDALMQFGKIEKAIYVASLIPKDYIRVESYNQLILLLFKQNNVSRAIDIAKMMPDYVDQSRALDKIAELLKMSGRQEDAVNVINQITHSHIRNSIGRAIS